MGRNVITGLFYYRLDTNPGDKIRYLLKKEKVEGYGIFILLLTRIYKHEGYFCKWDEFNQVLFCDDGIQLDSLKRTVTTCLEIGLFDKEMHEKYQILTSAEIQSRYIKIISESRRKGVGIDSKYLLIKMEEIQKKSEEKVISPETSQIHSAELAIHSEEIQKKSEEKVISPETSQIHSAELAIPADKEKESKVNEIKVNNFINIGGQLFAKKPSEAIEEQYEIRLSALLSTSLRDLLPKKTELFERFDERYNGYDFRDANHLFNALGIIADEIRNPKKKSYSAKVITPNIDEIEHE